MLKDHGRLETRRAGREPIWGRYGDRGAGNATGAKYDLAAELKKIVSVKMLLLCGEANGEAGCGRSDECSNVEW